MIIADTNEFHPLVDGKAYHDSKEPDGSNHPIVIMRATYGTSHEDNRYASSIGEARLAGELVGHYGYMVASEDAHAQGVFFGNTVKSHGGIKPGDTIWCDAEEGSGDQTQRVLAFLKAAHGVLHDNPVDEGIYSGAAFWGAQLKSMPKSRSLRWVAAYGQADPKLEGEDLWQFTDHHTVPGVSGPCDASIFNGTVEDFRKLVDPPLAHKGPYRHEVASHGMSIDALALVRKTTVDELIALTRAHADAKHIAILDAYLALRATLQAIGAPGPLMPIGFVYFTASK